MTKSNDDSNSLHNVLGNIQLTLNNINNQIKNINDKNKKSTKENKILNNKYNYYKLHFK